MMTALTSSALAGVNAPAQSCSLHSNDFLEIRTQAVGFAVLEACKGSIDKSATYSAWGGWKPCLCGFAFSGKQTAVGLWEGAKQAAQHPLETASAILDFFSHLTKNVIAIHTELSARFLKHAELSFEEKKAINCQVVTQVALFRTAVGEASELAFRGVKAGSKLSVSAGKGIARSSGPALAAIQDTALPYLSRIAEASRSALSQSQKRLARVMGSAEKSAYRETWAKADWKTALKTFAGENPEIIPTETGKVLILNPQTQVQVVLDPAGKYFRIQDLKITGKRSYLDLHGKQPMNKMVNGKNVGIPQTEYNQITHFLIDGFDP